MPHTAEPSPIEIQKYLHGVDYPADPDFLAAAAHRNGAPRDVLELLRKLPGKMYDSPAEVMDAYGHVR